MAESTKIEWTDATVNFWWGCTKVGPGCDHCYAESFDRRVGGAHWGIGAPRRKIASAVKMLHRLDNGYSEWAADAICRRENAKAFGLPVPTVGNRRRVFIQSMSDLFDLEVPLEWFAEAWDRIHVCNRLEIQIVTKRVSAIEKRLAAVGKTWPKHAGLIITVVDQDEADRDIPRALALMERFRIPWLGLSCEPLLGAIRLPGAFLALGERGWCIVGGESGAKARPMHPDWARSIRDQCEAAGTAFFFKQNGAYEIVYDRDREDPDWRRCDEVESRTPTGRWLNLEGGHGFHGARVVRAAPVGKAAAGRLLDGREWNEFPEVRPPEAPMNEEAA